DGGDGGIGVRARLEIDFDDADSGQRARLDVLDAAAKGEEALEAAGDVGLDLLRRHAVIEGRDDDHRDVHRGEHGDRHADERGGADNGDDQTDDHDKVRIADGEARHYCSFAAVIAVSLGLTCSPGWRLLRPATTTRSPSLRPLVTSTRSGDSRPRPSVRTST